MDEIEMMLAQEAEERDYRQATVRRCAMWDKVFHADTEGETFLNDRDILGHIAYYSRRTHSSIASGDVESARAYAVIATHFAFWLKPELIP